MNDKDRIKALGGPTKVAELLGYNKARGGVQRVQNWLDRGIPPAVKLKFPHIFLTELKSDASETTPAGESAHA